MFLIDILKENKNLSSLQVKCLNDLANIFDESQIEGFSYEDYFYDGTFGKYQGKGIYAVDIKLRYKFYDFEFIITYNQLEYYISNKGKIIFECNLEDFWEDDIFLKKYLGFLQADLKKIG